MPLKRGNSKRKINIEQREALLRVYLTEGKEAAEVLCAAAGVAPSYAAKLASERGCAIRRKTRKLTADEKAAARRKRVEVDADDPRWALARERGAISL